MRQFDNLFKGVQQRVHVHGARVSKFALVGALNTAVDFGVYAVLVFVSVPPLIANIPAFLVANVQSYFVNARFTFRQGGQNAQTSLTGYAKYAASHSLSLLLTSATIFFVTPYVGPLAAKLAGAVLSVGCNYFLSTKFVFKPSPNPSGLDNDKREKGGAAPSADV